MTFIFRIYDRFPPPLRRTQKHRPVILLLKDATNSVHSPPQVLYVDRSEAEMGMIYYRVITYKVNMNEIVVEHCTKLQNFPQNLRST